MADNANYIGDYRTQIVCLNNAHGLTTPVCVWKPKPASVKDASSAYQNGTRARGSRIHSLTVSAFATSAQRTISLLRARQATPAAGQGLAIGSASTITRTSGSFLVDGWLAGQRAVLLDMDPATEDGGLPAGALQNRSLVTVSAVAAQTLTLSGTPFTGASSINSTAALLRVAGSGAGLPITSLSGNVAGQAAANLLSNVAFPGIAARPDSCLIMGAGDALLAIVSTTALNAGESMEFIAEGGDY